MTRRKNKKSPRDKDLGRHWATDRDVVAKGSGKEGEEQEQEQEEEAPVMVPPCEKVRRKVRHLPVSFPVSPGRVRHRCWETPAPTPGFPLESGRM